MKNKNDPFKKLIRSLISIVLVSLETLVFAYVWIKEYNADIVVPFVEKGNWFFYLVYIILMFMFLSSFDGLKFGQYRRTNLIISQLLASLATTFIVYLQIVLLSAKFVSPLPLVWTLVIDALIIVAITFLGNFLLSKLFPPRKTLLIYDSYPPETFLEKATSRRDKFKIEQTVHVSIGHEKLTELVSLYDCVIIYDVHSEKRNKILKICFEAGVRTYTTTKVSDILVRGAESLHIFDTPLLLYRNFGLTAEQRFIKRTIDIIVSLLMIILSSPFMLLSALAIKLYDGGPVFFRQARCTIGGKVFRIHKFRSMIVDAEKDGAPHPAEKEDPRITPVGKFLRKSRLDELPQLFDILSGNMSLVGPRPERIEHCELYSSEIPEFSYRLKVRGGLTGYAQLYGKYNTTPYDKLQLDLMYIQNYSLFLDIKLILMTIKIMFMKESTEGFSEEKSRQITDDSKK